MTKTLHFTLGPVQSFVEQARRTRDLWAGSFLLSYLSGQAMKAVLEADGNVVFPAVQIEDGEPTDELLRAIMGRSHNFPQIGSLPNRFKASVPEEFDPKQCEQAVKDAWRKVVNAVWYGYVIHVAEHNQDTQSIWNRQVEAFWDMAWVVGASDDPKVDGAWLDQRKNWRTYQPPMEGGDHCTLMGDWQELSGYVRAKEVVKQDEFWEKLRGKLGTFELGEHERLCAIALIKRLYPKVSEKAIGWELRVQNWPSTPYMAAVPWLEQAHQTAEAKTYLRAIEEARLEWAFGEYNTDLSSLQGAGKFTKLDGNFFHETALENENATPFKAGLSEAEDEELRQELVSELQKVSGAVGRSASTFYALLLMDGDSLGKLLQREGVHETEVSKALSTFTDQVDGAVKNHSGKTVYAGGDDVMALLPLDRALEAANELRGAYLEAFKEVSLPKDLMATISGAVIFAHYNLSLRAVLKEAHHQLDGVAKEGNGRDSLAVSVLTGSGRTVHWVSSWHDKTSQRSVTEMLSGLARTFEADYSSSFFYNVRERFELLTDDDKRLIEGLEPLKLLTAEYLKNREQGEKLGRTAEEKRTEAEERVGQLLRACRTRKYGEEDLRSLDVGGALLVRFLATKGEGVKR